MGKDRMISLLEGKPQLLKGELWINPEILQSLGLKKRQLSLIKAAVALKADFCFFSFKSPIEDISTNSRYMHQLGEEARRNNLGFGITIDGPFERVVNEYGFMDAMPIIRDTEKFKNALKEHVKNIRAELRQACEVASDLIIICDDVAYNRGLYISPKIFEHLIIPVYQELIGQVKDKFCLGFHSDGDIEAILPSLIRTGFRIFSLEAEAMDLVRLKKEILSKYIIMSGLKAKWLFDDGWLLSEKEQLLSFVKGLYGENGLILSSTCGLYHESNIRKIKQIYELVNHFQI